MLVVSRMRLFVCQLVTCLLVVSLDCVMCSTTTATTEINVSEYSPTHTANQISNPPEDVSQVNSLEPNNTLDISNLIASTSLPQHESLRTTELSHRWSETTFATNEISSSWSLPSHSIDQTLVTTLLEQSTVAKEIVESSQNDIPNPTLVESLSNLVETKSNSSESLSNLVTSPSDLAELTTHLVELPSPVAELKLISSTYSSEPSSTLVESTPILESGVATSHSFNNILSDISVSLWQSDESLTVSEPWDVHSTDLMSHFMQPSSDSTYIFSTPILIDSNTISYLSSGDISSVGTMELSASVNETSFSHDGSFTPVATLESSGSANETMSIYIATSESSGSENETMSFYIATSESANETMSFYIATSDSTSMLPQPSDMVMTAEDSTLTVESVIPSTPSIYDSVNSSFPSTESSSGYHPLTYEAVSASDTVTVSINSLSLTDSITSFDAVTASVNSISLTDSITSSDTVSLITTTESGVTPPVETSSAPIRPHPTTSTTSTKTSTPPTGATSSVTSPTPEGVESTSPVQNLPAKSRSGLSTGGKVAIGIIIPLAVFGLIILGVFFYRRYNWSRGNFKNYLQPGVHYRAYTNETFTDDDVSLGGSWRKMSDS